MSYSFTEKKRIRKSFANRPSVLAVPPRFPATMGWPAFVLLVMTWLSQSLMLQSASSVV